MNLSPLGNLRTQRKKLIKLLGRPLTAIDTEDAEVLAADAEHIALSREAVARRIADIDAEIRERTAVSEKLREQAADQE